jgi:tetratricopeptide (TPR) repeat protein
MLRQLCSRFLLALTLFLPYALFAQFQQLGTIAGQIHVNRGDFPQHQVLVELRLHGATLNSAYADDQGHFSFGGLLANEYHVVISDEAYSPVDERVEVDPAVATTNVVQIILFPREVKKASDPSGAPTMGRNPYLTDPADYNKRFPKKAVKEYEKALEAEQKGEHDQAIVHYLNALKIAPEYFPAHNNLGALYLSNKDFKSAEEQFRDAIRIDQNEAQAYFNLGNVLLLTGRNSEAENILQSGLQRRPDSAFGHFLEGCLLERQRKFDEAEKSLREALGLEPTMSQAQLQLVTLYLQQNRQQDAIDQLHTFLKDFPKAPMAPKAKELLLRLQNTATSKQ